MNYTLLSLIFCLYCFTSGLKLQAQQGTMPLSKNAQYEIIPSSKGGFLVAEITNLDKVERSQVNFIQYDSLCRDRSNSISIIPWQPVFNGSISAGPFTVISFFSAVTNKTVFITLDQNGEKVNGKEMDIDRVSQIPKLVPFSASDGFFITSRNEKNWRDIAISKMDFQYNVLWKKEFRQEKEPITIDKLEKIGDKIFVFQQVNAASKKYQGTLVVLDEKTGKTLFEQNLTGNQVIKTPTAFGMDGENILVAGLYVTGNTIKDNYCDGFYLASYTPGGQLNFETFNPWQHEVKQVYLTSGVDHSRISANDSEKAIVQYIKKTDKGYAILAETFKQVPNGADAAAIVGAGLLYSMAGVSPFINPRLTTYKMFDMLLYDMDDTGHIQQVSKIDKPEVVRSIPVDLGELKVINTLQEYGVFDYKFSATSSQSTEEYIFFREYIKKERFKVNIIRLSDLQRSQVKSYDLLVHTTDFQDIRQFDFAKGDNGSVLMYYYTKKALSFKKLYPKDFN